MTLSYGLIYFMHTHTTRYHSLRIILYVLYLAPAAYGMRTHGLSIDQITHPNHSATNQELANTTAEHIDQFLASHTFPEARVDTDLAIEFLKEDDSTQETDEHLSDTDMDNESRKEAQQAMARMARLPSTQYARHTRTTTHTTSTFFLSKNETTQEEQSTTLQQTTLCEHLSQDAFRIANACNNSWTRSSTTCLCVVLRNRQHYARKFVFHNRNNQASLPTSMRKKAAELRYEVGDSDAGHAEVQLIRFLLQRTQQSPHGNRYTHILGMGCNRLHCKECDCLFKLFLGKNYHENFTAAMKKNSGDEAMPIIEVLPPTIQPQGISMVIPEVAYTFVSVHKQAAIQNKYTPLYRLSTFMKTAINEKSNLPLPHFSKDRFNVKKEEEDKKDNKRRRSQTAVHPAGGEE